MVFMRFRRILPTCGKMLTCGLLIESRNYFRDCHFFTKINHGPYKVRIKWNSEWDSQIRYFKFSQRAPSVFLKLLSRSSSGRVFLHAFIWSPWFKSLIAVEHPYLFNAPCNRCRLPIIPPWCKPPPIITSTQFSTMPILAFFFSNQLPPPTLSLLRLILDCHRISYVYQNDFAMSIV